MSDWRERSIKRRDERHTKIEDAPVRRKTRRNKKRWCRGKIGVDHDPVWVAAPGKFHFFHDTRIYKCSKCGKEFEMWYTISWARRNWEKPVIGSRDPLRKKTK